MIYGPFCPLKQNALEISATQHALEGLQRAGEMMNRAAESIAGATPEKGEGNLVKDIVDLKVARHMFKANIIVLKEIGNFDIFRL